MKSYQKRSKVLSIANALVKKGWSFSAAQKRGWEVVRCICQMKKDEVVLRYFSESEPEIPQQRTATLSPAFYSYASTATAKKKENPLQVKYYDTFKNGFRSFNVERFDSFKSVSLPF